ncbi:hypothetical protein EWI07_03925 [Sporolactobacillus sp. THM7-4]|nr:hypothetical protein EWI07_03925 [Sporolactobacillus sp. THM7-4]
MKKAVQSFIALLFIFSLTVGMFADPWAGNADASSSSKARVTASALYVRSGPGMNYARVGLLYRNSQVTVTGTKGSWKQISYKGKTRYVSGRYLTSGKPPVPKPKTYVKKPSSSSAAVVVTAGALNMRSGSGAKYRIVALLHKGNKVSLLGTSHGWYKVKYRGKTGYISEKYAKRVSSSKVAPKKTAKVKTASSSKVRHTVTQPKPATALAKTANPKVPAPSGPKQPVKSSVKHPVFTPYKAQITAGALNIRSGPGTKYRKVALLYKNDQVTVIGTSGSWLKVSAKGKTGYISGKYAKKGQPKPSKSGFTAFTAYIGYDNLGIYNGPGSTYPTIARLREKTPVRVIGQSGSWSKVSFSGRTGYILSGNLDRNASHFNPPAGKRGVDVSHHKGTVDFNKVKKAGNSFVILKASEGKTVIDDHFVANVSSARKARLQVHAYHFFHARNQKDARLEAQNFVRMLRSAGANNTNFGHVFVDVEPRAGSTVLFSHISRRAMADNINAFLDEMKSNGFSKLGIYSNQLFYRNNIDTSRLRKGLLVWIARYRGMNTCQGTGTPYKVDIWQFTSNGTVNGITGPADVDVAYSFNF